MNAVTSKRPRTVTLAVAIFSFLLIAGLALSLLNVPHNRLATIGPKLMPYYKYFQYSTTAAGVLINAFFIYKIFQGRNWARIIYLVFFLVGLVFSIPSFLGVFDVATGVKIYGFIAYLVQLVGLVLLFTAPGKLWFAQQVA